MTCARFLKISAALVLALQAFISARAAEPTPADWDRQASAFVKKFPKIRIGISPAPGNGHQGYAVMVMKRLRALGFKGEFEVYYSRSEAKKLEYLLPGFKAGIEKPQNLPDKVVAIEWEKTQDGTWNDSYKRGKLPLGFMGGDDQYNKPTELGVSALIKVQPSGWHIAPSITASFGDDRFVTYLPGVSELGTKLRGHSSKSPATLIQEELSHSPKLAEKQPGLLALVRNYKRLEVLTAYGLTHSAVKVANMILALDLARKERPELFRGPIVIPMLSGLSEQDIDYVVQQLRQSDVARKFVSKSASDRDIAKTVRELRPDQILLMHVGAVSQDLFHSLLEMSTLPPTVAGKSGTDYAKSLGRPFINTVDSNEIAHESHEKFEHLKEAHGAITEVNVVGQEYSAELVPDLARYFVAAKDPKSWATRMFRELGEAHQNQPDKVSAVIVAATEVIEGRGQGTLPMGDELYLSSSWDTKDLYADRKKMILEAIAAELNKVCP